MSVITGIDLNSSEQKICLKYKSEFSLTLAIKKKPYDCLFDNKISERFILY